LAAELGTKRLGFLLVVLNLDLELNVLPAELDGDFAKAFCVLNQLFDVDAFAGGERLCTSIFAVGTAEGFEALSRSSLARGVVNSRNDSYDASPRVDAVVLAYEFLVSVDEPLVSH
jgi:hypothetical protein